MLTVEKAASRALSDNTRRAYSAGWNRFVSFCGREGMDPQSASDEDVARFLVHCASAPRDERATVGGLEPVAIGTIEIALSAINRRYKEIGRESPGRTLLVQDTMTGLRRMAPRRRRVKPLLIEDLERILIHIWRVRGVSRLAIRDSALLAIGFAAALRRMELVSLRVEDVQLKPSHAVLTIRRSKTDQENVGQHVTVPNGRRLAAVSRLRAWMESADLHDGRVFRSLFRGGALRGNLHHSDIPRLVKHYVQAIGLDPAEYSGHSLRAGFVTSAVEAGARLDKIMEVTRHSSLGMVMHYTRSVAALDDHAGEGIL